MQLSVRFIRRMSCYNLDGNNYFFFLFLDMSRLETYLFLTWTQSTYLLIFRHSPYLFSFNIKSVGFFLHFPTIHLFSYILFNLFKFAFFGSFLLAWVPKIIFSFSPAFSDFYFIVNLMTRRVPTKSNTIHYLIKYSIYLYISTYICISVWYKYKQSKPFF